MPKFPLFLFQIFLLGRAPTSGGDAEVMVNGEDNKKQDTIVITGKADNCEAAKQALLVSIIAPLEIICR